MAATLKSKMAAFLMLFSISDIENMVLDTKTISVRIVGSSLLLFLTTSFHYSHLEPNTVV